MFSGQSGTATRAVFRAGFFVGAALSAATAKRGGFGRLFLSVAGLSFAVISGAGVGSQFHHCASFQSNSAFERDWPISVLFAACGFLNIRGSGQVSWRPAPQFER